MPSFLAPYIGNGVVIGAPTTIGTNGQLVAIVDGVLTFTNPSGSSALIDQTNDTRSGEWVLDDNDIYFDVTNTGPVTTRRGPYLDADQLFASYVDIATAQTITGIKSFQNGFVVGSSSDTLVVRSATGPTIDLCAAGGIRSRNLANNANAPIVGSSGTFSGNITFNQSVYRSDGSTGLGTSSAANVWLALGGTQLIGSGNANEVVIRQSNALGFSNSAANVTSGYDVNFNRSAAGTIRLGTTSANALGTLNLATLVSTGIITAGDSLRVGTAITNAPWIFPFDAATYTTQNVGGRGLTLYSKVIANGSTSFAFSGDAFAPISGTNTNLLIARTISPTSGTAIVNFMTIQPTINQTGGANGITRSLYIAPTLTAAFDHRGLEIGNCGIHCSIKTGTGPVQLGDSLTWTPAASITPTTNGQVTVEFTSNTSITIKGKGTDGTVRSTVLTIA